MYVTTIDTRYISFCPTPDNFASNEDYDFAIKQIIDLIAEGMYMECKLALKGFDISAMDGDY